MLLLGLPSHTSLLCGMSLLLTLRITQIRAPILLLTRLEAIIDNKCWLIDIQVGRGSRIVQVVVALRVLGVSDV